MKKKTGSFLGYLLGTLGKPFFYLLLLIAGFFDFIFGSLSQASQKIQKINLAPIRLFKPKKIKTSFKLIFFLLGNLVSLVIILYFSFLVFKDLPSPTKLLNRQQSLSTKIYDRNGALLYKIYRGKNRTPIL